MYCWWWMVWTVNGRTLLNRVAISSARRAAVLLLLGFGIAPVSAQDQVPAAAPAAPLVMPSAKAVDPFMIEAVPVDATGNNTVAARERGLAEGRLAGWRRLVQRIVPNEHISALPTPSQGELIDLIGEFSVANERSSAVRYLADLTFRFNPTAVRGFLGRSQVPFAEIPSPPLVIVPISALDPTAPPVLWGDPDEWKAAWSRQVPRDSLVPMIVPLGDLGDIASMTVDQAYARDPDALRKYARRYGGGGVLIATLTASPENPDSFIVDLVEARNTAAPVEYRITGQGRASADIGAALDQVASAAAREVEQAWKSRTMLQVGVGGEIVALADISTLEDWLRLRAKLRRVPLISRIELQAMTRNRVQVMVAHAGTAEQLQAALGTQMIDLMDVQGLWMMSAVEETRIEAAPAEPAPAVDAPIEPGPAETVPMDAPPAEAAPVPAAAPMQ